MLSFYSCWLGSRRIVMNSMKRFSTLFFRHLWVVFTAFLVISLVSIAFSAYILVENHTKDSTDYHKRDLSSRINMTYRLLEGFSAQPELQDLSLSVMERAMSLKAYASAFDFWMIGVVDPDGTISSTLRPKIGKVARDYIPRILSTGEREISDPFPAGATGDMIYTQFMPVKKDGKTVSICFVSTPLEHLSRLINTDKRHGRGEGYALLLDSTRSIMAHPDKNKLLLPIEGLVASERFLYGSSQEKFLQDIKAKRSGEYLSLFEDTLYFTAFTPIDDTDWMLIHRIRIVHAVRYVLMGLLLQTAFYVLVFTALYRYAQKIVSKEIKPMDALLQQMDALGRSLGTTGHITTEDFLGILHLSREGLSDALTGLPTRTLFRQKAQELIAASPDQTFGFFFIDMDNLKIINDQLGHKYGDEAIKTFASLLATFARRHSGLCCRYGGDEFVLILPLDTLGEASDLARELLALQRGSVSDGERSFFYGASIGVAFYPLECDSLDKALQHADIALYDSKHKGKGTFSIYLPQQNAKPE